VKSIRTFLVCALLAVITLVSFVAIVNGYSDSMREARELFDGQLEKQLLWLDEITALAPAERSATSNSAPPAMRNNPSLPILRTGNGSLSSDLAAAFRPLSNSRRISGSSLMTSTLDTGLDMRAGGRAEGRTKGRFMRQLMGKCK